jgi:hypothetical protein
MFETDFFDGNLLDGSYHSKVLPYLGPSETLNARSWWLGAAWNGCETAPWAMQRPRNTWRSGAFQLCFCGKSSCLVRKSPEGPDGVDPIWPPWQDQLLGLLWSQAPFAHGSTLTMKWRYSLGVLQRSLESHRRLFLPKIWQSALFVIFFEDFKVPSWTAKSWPVQWIVPFLLGFVAGGAATTGLPFLWTAPV